MGAREPVPNDLKEQFIREASDRLHDLERGLLAIEQGGDVKEQIRLIFRGCHGLKGIAYYVSAREIIELTEAAETLLARMRDRGVPFRAEWVDLLLECHDELKAMLDAFRHEELPPAGWKEKAVRLRKIASAQTAEPTFKAEPATGPDTTVEAKLFDESAAAHLAGLDIYFHKWKTGLPDSRLVAAVSRKLAIFAASAEQAGRTDMASTAQNALKELEERSTQTWTTDEIDRFCRISNKLRSLLKPGTGFGCTSGEAVPKQPTSKAPVEQRVAIKARYVEMMEGLVDDFAMYTRQITRDLEQLKKTAKPTTQHWLKGMESDLFRFAHAFRQSCRRLHLVPMDTVFQRFPREVRDLAKREGKKVNLLVRGGNTEMEQHQSDKLAEAMTHLIRNAVDHGIETPEQRAEADKPETGRVSVSAALIDGAVTIEIEDDGKGIDFPGLKQKAVELNLVDSTEVEQLPREKLMDLIFLTGISTTAISDTISGRGVGMDIVREAMEELGANIQVKSSPGRGTRFTLSIPMDLKL